MVHRGLGSALCVLVRDHYPRRRAAKTSDHCSTRPKQHILSVRGCFRYSDISQNFPIIHINCIKHVHADKCTAISHVPCHKHHSHQPKSNHESTDRSRSLLHVRATRFMLIIQFGHRTTTQWYSSQPNIYKDLNPSFVGSARPASQHPIERNTIGITSACLSSHMRCSIEFDIGWLATRTDTDIFRCLPRDVVGFTGGGHHRINGK